MIAVLPKTSRRMTRLSRAICLTSRLLVYAASASSSKIDRHCSAAFSRCSRKITASTPFPKMEKETLHLVSVLHHWVSAEVSPFISDLKVDKDTFRNMVEKSSLQPTGGEIAGYDFSWFQAHVYRIFEQLGLLFTFAQHPLQGQQVPTKSLTLTDPAERLCVCFCRVQECYS